MNVNELSTYDAWRDCITRRCRIAITAEYVTGRVAAMSDERSPEMATFIRIYGDEHRRRVLGYFERARASLAT
jgi:hypothetical protein